MLEGRLGALLGDQVVYAKPGDFVFKPRNQWHAFWNADDSSCRILEIISPGGFEHYFEELVEMANPDVDWTRRYGNEIDAAATSRIRERFGLLYPRLDRR